MAWRRNKRAEPFGGCALHDCQTYCAIAGYILAQTTLEKYIHFFFTIHLAARGLGVDTKDSTASKRVLSWSLKAAYVRCDLVQTVLNMCHCFLNISTTL